MAEALGDVSKSQVDRLYRLGMPRTSVEAARSWRLANLELSRTADSRIDRPQQPAATDATAGRGSHDPQGLLPGGEGPDSSPPTSDDPAEPVDEHTLAYRRDRAANERIKSERAQLELDQLRGRLVDVREIAELQFTAARIVRDRIEMVPSRVSADLHALVLSLITEEHRPAVAAALEMHTFERRLADALRDALSEAAKAIEEARRDDDDPDA